MLHRIECSGAPRDLGFAQGRACKDALRDHVARAGGTLRKNRHPLGAIRPWSSGAQLGAGTGREMIRHYPHLAERMAGLALGADLPLDSLMASFVAPPPSSQVALAAPGIALAKEAVGDEPAVALRTFALSPVPGLRPILRRSRPEVGFPSVELTLPWLVSALAGVNSEGLAVLIARTDVGDGRGAPPILLVQECLQRFASVDGCLDWCLKRSAHGRAVVFIAQGAGDVAAVEFAGDDRRVIRPSDGVLTEGVTSAADAELRKRVRDRNPAPRSSSSSASDSTSAGGGGSDWLDLCDWLALGAQQGGDAQPDGLDLAGGLLLTLEPASCSLRVRGIGAAHSAPGSAPSSELATELVAT